MSIDKSILEIEKLLPFLEIGNHKVSKAGIAWHIDHSLKVINSVCDDLKKVKSTKIKPTHSFIKSYVFLTGNIPRGKAKAPKQVVSTDNIIKETVEEQLILAKNNLTDMKKLPTKNYFSHPYFGMLSLKKSLRFLEIHTNHHLKIVNDILKNND